MVINVPSAFSRRTDVHDYRDSKTLPQGNSKFMAVIHSDGNLDQKPSRSGSLVDAVDSMSREKVTHWNMGSASVLIAHHREKECPARK